jgi:hypothetical protein
VHTGARGTGAPAAPLAPLLDLPGVAAAATAAREAVDRLLGHRVLRRQSAAVSAESALRGARASAVLEGVDVSLADLRAGVATDAVVQGALRVSAGLGDLAGAWERAPLQVVARLHTLAAAGTGVPVERLGRPAGDPRVSARLDALASLIADAGAADVAGTRVPAVVVAAVVHGELRALAPFGAADGIVARGCARLTLITRGLDPKAVGVPEVGHLALAEDYDAALAAYRSGAAEGVAAWLRHCCRAVELGAQEGLAICEAVLRG